MSTDTRGRLRRLNHTLLLPPLAVAGVAVVALDARSFSDVLILGTGVVAGLIGFWFWAADDLNRVALPCLVVTGAAWPIAVWFTESPNGSFGLTLVACLLIPNLRRWSRPAAVALPAYIAAVGATRLLAEPGDTSAVLLQYVIVPAGIAIVVTAFMFPNKRFYDVVHELEASRQREAELAVIRERVRFASDLHDIQGHTLHVVKLKTALAQKLVHSDPDRAADELREIHGLVSDTIKETKELAYAQRRLNLTAELENARNLFEAAGIQVRIHRRSELDDRTSELLGQVLRETTTNILRHAQAAHVRITLSATGIAIVNDGAPGDAPPELRGLSALRLRVAADGGELTVRHENGEFCTAATFPAARPDAG